MKFINYLENIDLELLISLTYILPFLGIIIILKIISVIVYSFVTDDEESEVTLFSNLLFYTIFSFFAITFYDYNDRSESLNFRFSKNKSLSQKDISIASNVTTIKQENFDGSVNDDLELKSFSWDDIEITSEAENLVNNARKNGRYVDLSSEDILKLKKILSDPNPNPMNRDGEKCSKVTKDCKWCGKEVSSDGEIMTSKALLFMDVNKETDNHFVEAFSSIYGIHFGDPKVCIQSYETSDNYQKKYQCVVSIEKEFCSLKCEQEYKNNRR